MLKSVICTITCALENSKQNPQTITMKSTHRSITQTAFYNLGWTLKLLIYVKKTVPGKLHGVINGLGGKTVHLEFFLEEKWFVWKMAQTEYVLVEKWIGEKLSSIWKVRKRQTFPMLSQTDPDSFCIWVLCEPDIWMIWVDLGRSGTILNNVNIIPALSQTKT